MHSQLRRTRMRWMRSCRRRKACSGSANSGRRGRSGSPHLPPNRLPNTPNPLPPKPLAWWVLPLGRVMVMGQQERAKPAHASWGSTQNRLNGGGPLSAWPQLWSWRLPSHPSLSPGRSEPVPFEFDPNRWIPHKPHPSNLAMRELDLLPLTFTLGQPTFAYVVVGLAGLERGVGRHWNVT